MDKATRGQVKQHNRRLVMRALFEEIADNRAALALETGLTKPTIGTIVGELIRAGYVTEDGFGISGSSGGKRPTIIRFVPTARQVIGVSVRGEEIIAGLAYLDGTVVARHHMVILPESDMMQALQWTINALMAQSDAPVLCIAVGVPGVVDTEHGIVISSRVLAWENVPLARNIQKIYAMPCYVSNNTELVTRMQVKESNHNTRQLVTVAIGDFIEIGSTFGGDIYQHGGDISQIPIPDTDKCVEDLQWKRVKQMAQTIVQNNPDSILAKHPITYLLIRRAVNLEEAAAIELVDQLAHVLAHVYLWITGLMRPSEIVLAGSISALGHILIEAIDIKLREQLSIRTMSNLRLTLAQSDHLSMQGAIIFALQQEQGIV